MEHSFGIFGLKMARAKGMTSDQTTLVMTEKSSKPQAIQSNSRQALAPETLPIVIVTMIIIHSPRFQTKFQGGVRESSTATWVHMLRTQYAFLRGVTLALQTNHHDWSNVVGPRNNHPQWMNFAGNSGEAVKQIYVCHETSELFIVYPLVN